MKIRSAFVANSSSSSFLIIGKTFKTEEEAEKFEEVLGKDATNHYIDYDSEYIAGFDIDPGLTNSVSGNAKELIVDINIKYQRLKDVMKDEEPVYHGYSGYDC